MSFRVTKRPAKKPSFLRSASSSSNISRIKPPQLKKSHTQPAASNSKDSQADLEDHQLDDLGPVHTLKFHHVAKVQDVPTAIIHAKSSMFDALPSQRSGMSGTRIAEVLNFRRHMPPIVSNSHVHALLESPTEVEREIGRLVNEGKVRRIIIPGRGVGAAAVSDAIVLMEDWIRLVEGSDLERDVKSVYMLHLRHKGNLERAEDFTEDQVLKLVHAGFLTFSSSLAQSTSSSLDIKHLSGTALSMHNIARAASGSVDANGGIGAIHRIGGGGSSGLKSLGGRTGNTSSHKLSLPNVGAYLELLSSAREHLRDIMAKSKYSEAPVYLLKERWDGGINTKNPYGRSKDPFKMILPGKTKKWKDFYGLNFDWVLAECLGAGMIELFNTHSVGLGARLVS